VPRAPLWPQTTTIEHRGGFFYGYPTASDTLRRHDQPDPRAAGAGHGALAQTVGQHHGDAQESLQPAVLQGHQRVAVDGHGLRLAVLGHVPVSESRRGERSQGRMRGPSGVLEGLSAP
jgi:hypothetical protein